LILHGSHCDKYTTGDKEQIAEAVKEYVEKLDL
jgi:hypothetical protein